MTLEEAIKHCLEKSRQCTTECERDHKQLAEWLEDYKKKCKIVRYFNNYYPADRHYTCPKCGEYVMEGLICLSCNTIIPTDKMKSLDPDILEVVNKHFNELL